MAVKSGCKAYLGYNNLNVTPLGFKNEFTVAANAANYALLSGATFSKALEYGKITFTLEYLKLLKVDKVAAGILLTNRNGLARLGDPNALAY